MKPDLKTHTCILTPKIAVQSVALKRVFHGFFCSKATPKLPLVFLRQKIFWDQNGPKWSKTVSVGHFGPLRTAFEHWQACHWPFSVQNGPFLGYPIMILIQEMLSHWKMALYCPQGSYTLRQQLLMMHGIAWYCMVLHDIAWYYMVLAWYCMVLHFLHYLALSCTLLHDLAISCTILHYLILSCLILHYLVLSCTILHYLALFCTILHYFALSCTILHLLFP